jgi:hypothetical protein
MLNLLLWLAASVGYLVNGLTGSAVFIIATIVIAFALAVRHALNFKGN